MARMVITALLVAACLALVAALQPAPPRQVLQARERWSAGQVVEAQAIAASALPRLARDVGSSPGDPERHMVLAEALALSGRRAEALAEARRAVEADPAPAASRARLGGGCLLESMAIVAMEAGATDEALELLEIVLARGWSGRRTPLANDPRFAPLRKDPRFASLLATYRVPSDRR